MSLSSTPDRKATVLLLLAIAGCVDAVGLAETGRYFVSFMSGNTTEIGLQLGYAQAAAALLPLGLAALFVSGATIGTLIAEAAGTRAAGALLLCDAALLALAWAGFGSTRPALGLVALPVAMGLANLLTLQGHGHGHGRAPRPGATYVTGVLVQLGIALAGLGRGVPARDAGFLAAAWGALLCGAAGGAMGRLRWGDAMLLVPTAVLLLLGLAALADARGDRSPPAA